MNLNILAKHRLLLFNIDGCCSISRIQKPVRMIHQRKYFWWQIKASNYYYFHHQKFPDNYYSLEFQKAGCVKIGLSSQDEVFIFSTDQIFLIEQIFSSEQIFFHFNLKSIAALISPASFKVCASSVNSLLGKVVIREKLTFSMWGRANL